MGEEKRSHFSLLLDKAAGDLTEGNTSQNPSIFISSRFECLRNLRQVISKAADKELGEQISKHDWEHLLSSEEFSSALFDLISTNEVKLKNDLLYGINSNKFGDHELDSLIDTFTVQAYGAFTGDVIDRSTFRKLWQNQYIMDNLFAPMKQTSTGLVPVSKLIRFLIVFFSGRELLWRDVERLESKWQSLKGPPNQSNFATGFGKETPRWFVKGFFQLLQGYGNQIGETLYYTTEEIVDNILYVLCQSGLFQVSIVFALLMQDGTDFISADELKNILQQGIKDNGVIFDDVEIALMVSVLLSETVCDESKLDLHSIIQLFNNHPELYDSFSSSMNKWLLPSGNKARTFSCFRAPKVLRWKYLKYHKPDIVFALVSLGILACFVAHRVNKFSHLVGIDGSRCYELIIARGSGVAINFLAAILILLMCRPVLTRIRMSKISIYVPVDHHVQYHKMAGIALFISSVIHTVAHLINVERNFRPNLKSFIELNDLTYTYEYKNYSFTEWLFTDQPKVDGAFEGWAYPTGAVLVIIMVIMGLGVHPKIREKGHFELFYWTHFLYSAFFGIMILHCDQAIWWLIIPLVVFSACKSTQVLRWIDGRGKTYVVSGVMMPSKVTQLIIKRTDNFIFNPGDWVFINIPSISMFEWHPFTISSSPQQDGVFTLHIRSLGGWTKRLNEYFTEEERQMRLEGRGEALKKPHLIYKKSVKDRFTDFVANSPNSTFRRPFVVSNAVAPSSLESSFDFESSYALNSIKSKRISETFNIIFNPWDDPGRYLANRPRTVTFKQRNGVKEGLPFRVERPKTSHSKKRPPLEVFIDGPYGAPSSAVFYGVEHAVLIATGIGVTPFASILQTIMHTYWEFKRQCPNCQFKWFDEFNNSHNFGLKKVDFIWINREQNSFEWFLQLLSQLEMEQAEFNKSTENKAGNFLDIHLYISSFSPDKDIKAATLKLALDLMHKKAKRDLITGLKTRTQSGRPDWDHVFRGIQKNGLDNVTVFYCGNPSLAETLTQKSYEFGFKFKKEIF